jgi:hypothetical protein
VEPIQSIAAIPFLRRPALELRNRHVDRPAPDPDYTGFGYARVDEVWLEGADGELEPVRDALVLALHCTDEGGEALAHDVELEFFVDEVAADYSVTVLLSAFLAEWLPRVRGDASTVVLALCNRQRATLATPESLDDGRLVYALGDVESWLDVGSDKITLRADRWRDANRVERETRP